MSSSGRNSPHRRRSHSASSPLPSSHHFAGDKWRPSCKRARPTCIRSPSLKDTPANDIADRCRKGKRARRDSSSPIVSSKAPCLFGSSPVFREQWASNQSSLPSSHLPSTSDAFALFPDRSRRASRNLSSTPTQRSSVSLSSSPEETSGDADLGQLRSSAFWELQRSIEESGEGMVSRMRDWEELHSKTILEPVQSFPDHYSYEQPSRIRKPSLDWTETLDDDEDDIQIIQTGHSSKPVPATTLSVYPSHQRWALSAEDMDMDDSGDDGVCPGPESGDNCSSPTDNSSCLSSGYVSDDDSPGSLVFTNSTNSSRASLPLHHVNPAASYAGHHEPSLNTVPSTASPSEKAIAALTLVMANGAGGLNDYEAVRSFEGSHVASVDDSLVGEMWN